jgi:hypothetical protein
MKLFRICLVLSGNFLLLPISSLEGRNVRSAENAEGGDNSTLSPLAQHFEQPTTVPSKTLLLQSTEADKSKPNTTLTAQFNASEKNTSNLYILPAQTFLTQEDRMTQEEWGGNCSLADWDRCKVIKTWFGNYMDKSDPEHLWKQSELDCILQPVLCMKNGWTVNRCHVLCMGRCNKG